MGLIDASLASVTFERSNLIACDAQRANLNATRTITSRLEGCNLCQVRASGSQWRHSQLVDCVFTGASFAGSRWRSVEIEGGETSYFSLEKAVLLDVQFRNDRLGGCPLMRVRFGGAFLIDCDLKSANLYGADLRRSVLIRTNLSGAHLDGADLTDAVLINCVTDRTDWADAAGVPPGLRGAS